MSEILRDRISQPTEQSSLLLVWRDAERAVLDENFYVFLKSRVVVSDDFEGCPSQFARERRRMVDENLGTLKLLFIDKLRAFVD
jgi:hypothetical protein